MFRVCEFQEWVEVAPGRRECGDTLQYVVKSVDDAPDRVQDVIRLAIEVGDSVKVGSVTVDIL